jgi:hypothetical protein
LFLPNSSYNLENMRLAGTRAPSLITSGGFQMDRTEIRYLAPFPKSWTYFFWGTAARRVGRTGSMHSHYSIAHSCTVRAQSGKNDGSD